MIELGRERTPLRIDARRSAGHNGESEAYANLARGLEEDPPG